MFVTRDSGKVLLIYEKRGQNIFLSFELSEAKKDSNENLTRSMKGVTERFSLSHLFYVDDVVFDI